MSSPGRMAPGPPAFGFRSPAFGFGPFFGVACLCLASCAAASAPAGPEATGAMAPGPPAASAPRDASVPVAPSDAAGGALARADEVPRLFARAYHLDGILGRTTEAEPLYRQILEVGSPDQRETALSHLRIATLCRARGDRRCAMGALDWLINHAARHPSLARTAEHEMVELLHPQAGAVSALTRGPPVSFTRLQQVPADVASRFRDAEQELLRYVRVPVSPQLHNVDAVVAVKRGALLSAVRAYDPLVKSQYQNAAAAGLFRQGSLHQDFAEALGRLRLPDELLARVAASLRFRFHGDSVTHFRLALLHYRRAAAITDVAAERWRQAAAQAEAQLGRFARRAPVPR